MEGGGYDGGVCIANKFSCGILANSGMSFSYRGGLQLDQGGDKQDLHQHKEIERGGARKARRF